MLKELYIENLAVIKQATIQFSNNLNIFTGETGAGKSILINGINAVLGQRITKDIVRSGCERAVISAVFTGLPSVCKDRLKSFGIDVEDDEIVITREISSDGGSVARVNSRPVNVSVLKDLGETLVNIHGQHDNQILLKTEKHIDIIDSFGELDGGLAKYRESFKALQDTARRINKLKMNEREKELRIDELSSIVEQIEEADISENEDISIEEEFGLLKNSTRILEGLERANAFLCGYEDAQGAIVITDNSAEELKQLADVMSDTEVLAKRLKSASIEIDDVSSEIARLISQIDVSPERLEYITNRRDELNKLKRKYGPQLSDVIKTYNDAITELGELEGNDDVIAKFEEQKEKLLSDVSDSAKLISHKREECCKKFVSNVCEELAFLDMPNVKLAVSHTTGKLTINGMDNIELLISANIGEPPRPIAKIASGGELSRIMLALKNVLAQKDDIPTLIFDEIDTGVSGRAAQKIGIKLAQISKYRQVLCVTHLAQIAVMADTHLCIEKKVVDNTTVTRVSQLDDEKRKYEIARIMGGDNTTELMLANAQQLIDSARQMI